MSWVCEVSKEALKQLRRFPKNSQQQIYSALRQMEVDPLAGDVCPIKSGRFQDCYRKRIGKYRIIFRVEKENWLVMVITVLRRSDTTY